MSKKSKKKKSILKSRFYQIYFGALALALILIVVGTVWLNGLLRDYESAQPVYVAQQVARLFEDKDFENIYALDTSAGEIAEGDRDFYVESMRDIASGKSVEWTEGFSTDEDERKYNVSLDGERFASFTLVPSGQETPRGNRLWTLGSVTTNVALAEPAPAEEELPEATPVPTGATVKVSAPQGYSVTVDGVLLTAENAGAVQSPLFDDGFLPQGVASPVMVAYTYVAEGDAPQIAVTDETGAAVQPTQAEDGSWSCPFKENEEYKAQFSQAAYALAQRIARYTSKDGGRDGILAKCAKDSPARTVFNNLSNQYATPHSDIAFQNEVVDQFYLLSDGCFTCHVSFDYLLKTSKGVMTFPTAYTFCIVRQGGGGLYNLLMY